MSAARLQHLMDQLEGAAMAAAHAELSTDPTIRTTVLTHVRAYDDLATEIEELCATSPEAREAFFHGPSTNREPTD